MKTWYLVRLSIPNVAFWESTVLEKVGVMAG